MTHEWTQGKYTISTDRARLDLDVIHAFLSGFSYWAQGRTGERVEQSIAASLPFGLYHGTDQVGFARVLTDYVTLGYMADVFVLDAHRGKGLGKWLLEVVTGMPDLQGVRRWLLATRDAHELYRKFGFNDVAAGFMMDRIDDDRR
jgi:GNAT superfamily N-acetyltransferase